MFLASALHTNILYLNFLLIYPLLDFRRDGILLLFPADDATFIPRFLAKAACPCPMKSTA